MSNKGLKRILLSLALSASLSMTLTALAQDGSGTTGSGSGTGDSTTTTTGADGLTSSNLGGLDSNTNNASNQTTQTTFFDLSNFNGTLPATESNRFAAPFQAPFGATRVGVLYFTGFGTQTVDLSQFGVGSTNNTADADAGTTGSGVNCANLRVYKVSFEGTQDLWNNYSCSGNMMMLRTEGRGHYILYRFSDAGSAAGAPNAIMYMSSMNMNSTNNSMTTNQTGADSTTLAGSDNATGVAGGTTGNNTGGGTGGG